MTNEMSLEILQKALTAQQVCAVKASLAGRPTGNEDPWRSVSEAASADGS